MIEVMHNIRPKDFFPAIFPRPVRPGQLMLWSKIRRSGRTHTDWCYNLKQATRRAEECRNTREVLFGVAVQDRKKALALARRRHKRAAPNRVRGIEASVVALPALWAEIGVGGTGAASAPPLPPGRDAALGLLPAVPRPPSIVVWTGDAFEVYWLLDKLWKLPTDDDRRRAKRVLCKVQWALAKAAASQGWQLDYSGDLARLMRVPDTFRHRGKMRFQVVVEQFRLAGEGDRRWTVSDFESLEDPPSPPRPGRRWLEAGAPAAPEPPADFLRLWRGCSWLRHCHDHQAALPEPEWRRALSIVGRSAVRVSGGGPGPGAVAAWSATDGRALAHRFSSGHPGYAPHLVDEELTRALSRKSGAVGCDQIARRFDSGAEHCSRCPNRGRIRSPIDLGRVEGGRPAAVAPAPPADRAPVEARGSGLPERPLIAVTGDESEVNAQALAALAGSREIFERGGVLVEVARSSGRPRVAAVPEPRLREILAGYCAFVAGRPAPGRPAPGRPDPGRPNPPPGDGGKPLRPLRPNPLRPPRWCTRALHGRGSWPELPALAGVVEGPVLRADGSVVEEAGYDRATGVYHVASGSFEPVPARPGDGEVGAALALLRETVCDFPFAGEMHYAAWLAALLTPLARPAFAGPSPLSFVDADRRGAGKSLLVDVASVILTGRPAPRLPLRRGEEAMERSITELVFSGRRLALYDNVTGVFGTAALARALTGGLWGDGAVELPQEISWWVTSNGVTLDADLPRRSLRIRLESADEHPEERGDFRHPRLLAWVGENRGRILPAALTLLRAYVAAGKPAQRLAGLGSFEEWSDLVRSTVVFHGLPDPGLARVTRSELGAPAAVAEHEVPAAFFAGFEELLAALGGRATARRMVEALAEEAHREAFGALRSALRRLYPELGGGLPTAQQLGYTLRSLSGREVGGRRIVQAKKNTRGVSWAVRKTRAS